MEKEYQCCPVSQNTWRKIISDIVENLMKARNMTQNDLGLLLGYEDGSVISKALRGKSRLLFDVTIIDKLSGIFCLDIYQEARARIYNITVSSVKSIREKVEKIKMEKLAANIYKIEDVSVLVVKSKMDPDDSTFYEFYAKKDTTNDFEFQFGASMKTAMEFFALPTIEEAIEQMVQGNYESGNYAFTEVEE